MHGTPSGGGFRIDWDASARDAVTVQGDGYGGSFGETHTIPSLLPPFSRTFDDKDPVAGGNILARWRRRLAEGAETVLQFYYDRTERDETLVRETRHTVDLDFQHRSTLGTIHEILWGLGSRVTIDDIDSSSTVTFEKKSRAIHLVGGFIQDQITLIRDRLHLTVGSKFEHNDLSGFEVQPSARLLWSPHKQHALWAAISRAVRTPSRAEADVRSNVVAIPPDPRDPSGLPTLLQATGSSGFTSEELLASELGYRVQPADWLSVDVAAFYNIYDNLRTVEPGTPFLTLSPAPPHIIVPLLISNKMGGNTYGVEIGTTWRPVNFWRLNANYSFLQINLHLDPSSQDTKADEGRSPRHQVQLLSHLDLPWNLQFDTAAYFVDRLPSFDIPRYLRLDLRLGWRPTEALDISLVGQNLLDDRHREFGRIFGEDLNPTEVQRSVYVKATWRF